jgi:uncharacterized protein (TIGR02391 family)
MPTLLEIFPDARELLALEPEDLAGVVIELLPGISQGAGFLLENLTDPVFRPAQGNGYGPGIFHEVVLALSEALSWLETQGLIVRNLAQTARWYLMTRRGRSIKTRIDLDAFRKGRTLPLDILQELLAVKVHHLFLRGDHDTAVFQAFKVIEVAVRKAGNYGNDMVGQNLMRAAFHPDTGPLSDMTMVKSERESQMHLFSGAYGHARNPTSHRDVNLSRQEAARLIVFASHLLAIVEEGAATLSSAGKLP